MAEPKYPKRVWVDFNDGGKKMYIDAEWLNGMQASVDEMYATAEAQGTRIGELSEEIMNVKNGVSETVTKIDILVGHMRNADTFDGAYESANRCTNATPIPVKKGDVIYFAGLSAYKYAVHTFDKSGIAVSDSNWVTVESIRVINDGYANIVYQRTDASVMTSDDGNVLESGTTITNTTALYVRTVNGIGADSDGNIDLTAGVVAKYTLRSGTSNSETGDYQYNAATRATFTEFVPVKRGGQIMFYGVGMYLYSPIRFDFEMKNVGAMGWISNTVFSLDYTGYLKINIQRVDGGAMDADDYTEIMRVLTVQSIPADNPATEEIANRRSDLMQSISIEFNRAQGASYQLIRIPAVTNDGRTVRPVVRLTSEDGSLNGTKRPVLTYARSENTAFAVNAGLFNVTTLAPAGQTIIDGVSVTNTPMTDDNGVPISETQCYPLCIDKNGILSAPYDRNVDTATMIADGVVQACTGWVTLVDNYAIDADEIATEIVHPQPYVQNVIGQFDNGDYILCMVANKGYGTSAPNDNGLTYTQVAQILVDKGVKFAYALDGGGSAQAVIGKRLITPVYEGTVGRAVPAVLVFEAK
jgi:hypothetical protein